MKRAPEQNRRYFQMHLMDDIFLYENFNFKQNLNCPFLAREIHCLCIIGSPCCEHIDKMTDIWQTTFSSVFYCMEIVVVDSNFTEIHFWSNLQQASNSSGNGFAPNRWQTITWTNVDYVIWRHMALLDRREIKMCNTKMVKLACRQFVCYHQSS